MELLNILTFVSKNYSRGNGFSTLFISKFACSFLPETIIFTQGGIHLLICHLRIVLVLPFKQVHPSADEDKACSYQNWW